MRGGPVDKWGETRDKKRSRMGQAPVFPVPSTYENSNLNFIFMPLVPKRDADYGPLWTDIPWFRLGPRKRNPKIVGERELLGGLGHQG